MISASRRAAVDLNIVLTWLNLCVFIATVAVWHGVDANAYVDDETIALAGLLTLETHVILALERRRRDPLAIVFVFVIVLFYSVRILTICVVPVSIVFDRYQYTAADSNTALIYILAANVFLCAGLHLGGRTRRIPQAPGWRPRSPGVGLGFVAITIAFLYTRGIVWDPVSLPRVLSTLIVFASQSIVLVMALAYYVVFRQALPPRTRLAFVALIAGEMALHTLNGSRSALTTIVQNLLIVVLAARGTITLRRRTIVAGLVLIPPALAAAVVLFSVSTLLRTVRDASGSTVTIAQVAALARANPDRLGVDNLLNAGTGIAFARAGFFDYSAEVIAHADRYASIMAPSAYLRSVADNVMTPGFDVFDQPKVGNALIFEYGALGTVSKSSSATHYQSDQIGIYGEFYVLLGWAAMPFFFLVGFLFKRGYNGVGDPNPFMLVMKKVVVLSIFVELINSFGMDWVLADAIPLVLSVYLYRVFFQEHVDPAPQPI